MTYRLTLILGLLMLNVNAFAWQNTPPPAPSLTMPSSAQLQSTPPADLLNSSPSTEKLSSQQVFQAWIFPVSGSIALSDAQALLTKLKLATYPVYLEKNGEQAIVYVGPEADFKRIEAWQIKLQQSIGSVGAIQAFNPLHETQIEGIGS